MYWKKSHRIPTDFSLCVDICEAARVPLTRSSPPSVSEAGLGGGWCCSLPVPLPQHFYHFFKAGVLSTRLHYLTLCLFLTHHNHLMSLFCYFFPPFLFLFVPLPACYFSLITFFFSIYFHFFPVSICAVIVVVAVTRRLLWRRQNRTSLRVLTYFHSSREKKSEH